VTELVIGLLLLGSGTVLWGALGALTLLVGFMTVILLTLRRGVAPPCQCFGRIHSAPIGRSTMARIGVLAVMAGALIAIGRDYREANVIGWFASFTALEAGVFGLGMTLTASVVAAASILVQLTSANGRLLLRIEELESRQGRSTDDSQTGLSVGAPAPAFTLKDLNGVPVSLDELRTAGRPVVLVFSDPNCGPCAALLPDLVAWEVSYGAFVTVVLISSGTADANRRAGASALHHALLQRKREVAHAYGAHATPTAVLVRADGRVDSPLAVGAAAISRLVMSTVGRSEIVSAPVLNNDPRRAIKSPSRWTSLEPVLVTKATENRLVDDAVPVRSINPSVASVREVV